MAFEKNMEVTSHDIDVNCHATPTNIVKYLLETVDSNMRFCGPSYGQLLAEHKSFIVSRTAVEVLRPLKEYEELSVSTWASESRSVTFPRSFLIKSGEEVVARCLMFWALVNTENGSFIKGSDFSVSGYGTGEVIELNIPSRFKMPADIPLKKVGEHKVVYSDIDRNRHMNNTKYFDMLFGCIPNPDEVWMSSCLMNYTLEAPYGRIVEIYMSDGIAEGDETVYYFKTQIDDKTNITAKMGVKKVK